MPEPRQPVVVDYSLSDRELFEIHCLHVVGHDKDAKLVLKGESFKEALLWRCFFDGFWHFVYTSFDTICRITCPVSLVAISRRIGKQFHCQVLILFIAAGKARGSCPLSQAELQHRFSRYLGLGLKVQVELD